MKAAISETCTKARDCRRLIACRAVSAAFILGVLSITLAAVAGAGSRLHMIDAEGSDLAARIEVASKGRAVLVSDDGVASPVRVDSTLGDENWMSLGGIPGADSGIYSAVTDVKGNLYVGGSFIAIGNVFTSGIAKWDGSEWSSLGLGISGRVNAMVFLGDDLYVGGDFRRAGDIEARNIAKWDGSEWSALGWRGREHRVLSLAVMNGDLYAGSWWPPTPDGGGARTIAKWDGESWASLGSGLNGLVNALAVEADVLYAGGKFMMEDSDEIHGVAKWDGTKWSPLAAGVNGELHALAVLGDDLYVAGQHRAEDGEIRGVAKWDGSEWATLGEGLTHNVYTLAVSGTDLYVGGSFLLPSTRRSRGVVQFDSIAKWNGSEWMGLGSGLDGPVHAIAIFGNDLYGGGGFKMAGGIDARSVAKWDGREWSALNSGEDRTWGLDGSVKALAVSGSNLYAGGFFTTAGGQETGQVATWDGNHWTAMGAGLDGAVVALAVADNSLYAGGYFTMVEGGETIGVAKWDGREWSVASRGLDIEWSRRARVSALTVAGTDLYAAVSFESRDDSRSDEIAKWDGREWSMLGPGLHGDVKALAVRGSDVFAAGDFTIGESEESHGVAKWDGRAWSALGQGISGKGYALAVLGNDLYVGGFFRQAGGEDATYVAKWDGDRWSALGSGLNGGVLSLAVSGRDLYAGGFSIGPRGADGSNIARWNGQDWVALGSGVRGSVSAVAASDSKLYVGGEFPTFILSRVLADGCTDRAEPE